MKAVDNKYYLRSGDLPLLAVTGGNVSGAEMACASQRKHAFCFGKLPSAIMHPRNGLVGLKCVQLIFWAYISLLGFQGSRWWNPHNKNLDSLRPEV